MDEEGMKIRLHALVRKKARTFLILVFSVLFLLFTITFAVMIGSVSLSPLLVWKIIFSHMPYINHYIDGSGSLAQSAIIWQIRLPRVLLACIVGAGLSVAGAAVQALVKNSIADPYILGVSSGASVGATLVITAGAFSILGIYALSIAAFVGALLSVLGVFFLAQVRGRISTVRLLLSGVAVSMILTALTNFIVLSAPNAEGAKSALFWMIGSLTGARWDYLFVPFAVFCFIFLFLWSQYRALNILLTGEESAVTLGINVHMFRKLLIIATALLTGVIVSVSGAIGFVGLMIPHIVRLFVGSNYKYVIPFSALWGAIFLIWADVLARTVISPQELPIGIITALVGGPFFIWLLRKSTYAFGGE
jgi:iron complex transport system permease protein